MNQHSSSISSNNSFFLRRHNELSLFLINEMGLESALANTILVLHRPSDIRETLNLFIVDEDGFSNHYFIPPAESEMDQCRVCEAPAHKHIAQNNQKVLDQLEQQSQNSRLFNEEIEEKIPEQNRQPCLICYKPLRDEDRVKIREEAHPICVECMETYLRQEIANNRVEGLGCPHCNAPFPNDVLQEFVDLPTFNKYQTFLRNLSIQRDPNLKWCPNPKCSVVIKTNPKNKTNKCPKCSTLICSRCNREAHPSSSCEGAFQKQIKNWENASGIQKCKKCHQRVQKMSGCNHMTCPMCNYQWCWLCGGEYSSIHYNTFNPFGCPGLQFRSSDDWGACKIVLLRIGLILLFLIGVPIAIPIAMVVIGPVMAIKFLEDCCYPFSCCAKFSLILLGVAIGLIGDPVIWVGCLVYFIPVGISSFCEWYRNYQQQQLRRNSVLNERMLAESIMEQQPVAELQ